MGTLTDTPPATRHALAPVTRPEAVLDVLSTVFHCLGRTFLGLDAGYRVVHASAGLDRLVADGAADAVRGRRAAEILGAELFGPGGALRKALEEGQRREDRPATLCLHGLPPRRVSLTAASLGPAGGDGRVAHIVVLRPAADAETPCDALATELGGLVTRTPAMHRVLEQIRRHATGESSVLISGEPGTGKELVARTLHDLSPRRAAPFGVVDCTTRPADRLASILFGHAPGACAGALNERAGAFELASAGTVFLATVGALPRRLQERVLRVLGERTFERLGERRPRPTAARLVAASEEELMRAAFGSRFLAELAEPLEAARIELPPLRERPEDIELAARRCLARLAARHGHSLWLGTDALAALVDYPWPGNLRELDEALASGAAVCRGQTLHAEDLPARLRSGGAPPRPASAPPEDGTDPDRLDRATVRAALDANRWKREATARSLGISRTTLWRRMRDLDLLD